MPHSDTICFPLHPYTASSRQNLLIIHRTECDSYFTTSQSFLQHGVHKCVTKHTLLPAYIVQVTDGWQIAASKEAHSYFRLMRVSGQAALTPQQVNTCQHTAVYLRFPYFVQASLGSTFITHVGCTVNQVLVCLTVKVCRI